MKRRQRKKSDRGSSDEKNTDENTLREGCSNEYLNRITYETREEKEPDDKNEKKKQASET